MSRTKAVPRPHQIIERMGKNFRYSATAIAKKFECRTIDIYAVLDAMVKAGQISSAKDGTQRKYFKNILHAAAAPGMPVRYKPDWVPLAGTEEARNRFRAGCEAGVRRDV